MGEDQRQHVELMRDIALRFNNQLEPVFVDVDAATWESFRGNMWDGEFVLTGSADDVAARSALRFSLGHTTTQADVDALVDAIVPVVERARAAGIASGFGVQPASSVTAAQPAATHRRGTPDWARARPKPYPRLTTRAVPNAAPAASNASTSACGSPSRAPRASTSG